MQIVGDNKYYIVFSDNLNFRGFYLGVGQTAKVNECHFVSEDTESAAAKRLFIDYKPGRPYRILTPKPLEELYKQCQNPGCRNA